MSVVVNDAGAVYPVRIDPTLSDANWISISPSIPGTDGDVSAAVFDGSGNLYIGGGHDARVRVVSASSGYIVTVAGGGRSAFRDGEPATATGVGPDGGVAVDGSGNLFIAHGYRVVKVTPATLAAGALTGF